jgi:hypothetical protein
MQSCPTAAVVVYGNTLATNPQDNLGFIDLRILAAKIEHSLSVPKNRPMLFSKSTEGVLGIYLRQQSLECQNGRRDSTPGVYESGCT